MRGAVILAAASMVSRVIGLAYMVVLPPRMIYADGMGLYQLVKPIHYFAAVLAIAGMPVAIAKMIAEEVARQSAAGVNKIFRWGFGLMAASGGAVALALIIGPPLCWPASSPKAWACSRQSRFWAFLVFFLHLAPHCGDSFRACSLCCQPRSRRSRHKYCGCCPQWPFAYG